MHAIFLRAVRGLQTIVTAHNDFFVKRAARETRGLDRDAMQPISPDTENEVLREILENFTRRIGLVASTLALGVSRQTLERVLGGRPVQRATLTHLRSTLDEIEKRTATVHADHILAKLREIGNHTDLGREFGAALHEQGFAVFQTKKGAEVLLSPSGEVIEIQAAAAALLGASIAKYMQRLEPNGELTPPSVNP